MGNLSTSGAEKAAGSESSAAKPVFQFGTNLSTSGAEKAAGSATKPVFQPVFGAEKAAGSPAFGDGLATNVGHEANLSQKAYVFSEGSCSAHTKVHQSHARFRAVNRITAKENTLTVL